MMEFFVVGSEDSALDKREEEPGAVIDPCNMFVVDTTLGPVLRAPDEMG